MSRVSTYIKESRHEVGKVIWPSRRELTNHTVLVIAVSVFIAAFIGAADFGFTKLFELLLRLR